MKVGRILFSTVLGMMNSLPAYGKALGWRGKWVGRFLKASGTNLKLSSQVNIYDPKKLSVGDSVYIGFNTYIGGGLVFLDDQVIIGPFVSIVAGNHTLKDGSYRFGAYDFGEIKIGKGTWLCANSVITNNVELGRGCLVAAGSVVTKSFEDFSIIGGVPAKLIRKLTVVEIKEKDV